MTKKLKILIVFLLILLIVFSISAGSFYVKINEHKKEEENLKNVTTNLELENAYLIKNLKIDEKEIENLSLQINEAESEIKRLNYERSAECSILGINDSTGRGEILKLQIVIKNGKGGVFNNITGVVFERDIQESINTALTVAKNVTGENLTDCDVMVTLAGQNNDDRRIAGKSGGAAICLAAISAIDNKNISTDVLITGTIKKDGKIGTVLGLKEKAGVAKSQGVKMILVPKGMEIRMEGIEVIGVSDIYEAQDYIFV